MSATIRLIGVKPAESGEIAIDDYVRFAFESRMGTGGTGTVAITDGDDALVEIGIDLATGRLRGATLVNYARRARTVADDMVASLAQETGLPVLDPDIFAGERDTLPRVSIMAPVDMLRANGIAIVRIGRGEPDRLVRAGRAMFLFADSQLWGFGAGGLDPREWSLMTG